jgi:WD40 repeat protein
MGTVYQAHDPELQRTVALKLPRFFGSDESQHQARERFLREARLAAAVRHPHVCPIYDVGVQDGLSYVVMAYLEGQSLADRLSGGRRIEDPAPAVELTRQIAEALAAVHEHGIVHRDLKPGNILLDRDGTALLADFGLARPEHDAEPLTEAGAVLGTPAFMAPEQAALNHGEVGPQSDVYSLGVVLYRMLTGRTPFEGRPLAVVNSVANQVPPPPSKFRPDLDRDLETILLKAMAREPRDRYTSALEFAGALRAWQRKERTAGKPVLTFEKPTEKTTPAACSSPLAPPGKITPRPQWPRWPWVAAASVLFLGLLAAGVTFVLHVKFEPKAKDAEQVAKLSALDKLNRKKDIAPTERLKWLPKEVVAVFGTHAWKHWAAAFPSNTHGVEVPRLTFGPGGKVIASAGNYAEGCAAELCWVWDAETGEQWIAPLQNSEAGEISGDPEGTWRAFAAGPTNGWHWEVWDVVTGKQVGKEFYGQSFRNRVLALSADRTILASGSPLGGGIDGHVTLWKVPEEKAFAKLEIPDAKQVYSVALSAAGKTLAALVPIGQGEKAFVSVRVWDLQKNDKSITLPKAYAGWSAHYPGGLNVTKLALSRDGRWVGLLHDAEAGAAHNLLLWDMTAKKERPLVFSSKEKNYFSSLAFSHDSTQLALGIPTGEIVIHDLISGKERFKLTGHKGLVDSLVFAPGGKALASAARDQTIRLWDLVTGEEKSQPGKSDGPAEQVALGGDRWLGVINGARKLTIRDLEGIVKPWTLPKAPNWQYDDLAFFPNGDKFLTAYHRGILWETVTGKKLDEKFSQSSVTAVAVAPDETLALALNNGQIWIQNRAKKKEKILVPPEGLPSLPLVFSPDGKYLATPRAVWELSEVWSNPECDPIACLGDGGYHQNVAFAPNGKHLAKAWWREKSFVELWDTATWKLARPAITLPSLKTGFHVGYCLGGKSLLAVGHYGHLVQIDATTGKKQNEWWLPGGIHGIATSSDGRHLVTANANGTVYILRLAEALQK